MTDAQVIAAVRSWIGTPWKHGVALKGWGVDCIQFAAAVYKSLGWLPADHALSVYCEDYSLHNSRSILREGLVAHGLTELEDKTDIKVGDVLVFFNGNCEAHAGVALSPTEFVHAHIRYGVIPDQLAKWSGKHVSTWRLA